VDFFDKNFFDNDGILLKSIIKFPSPTNQTMILFKQEHELAMGGPLMGQASILLENQVLVKLDGIFSEQVLWQTNGQYVALAKWSKEEGRHVNHKICVIDLQNLQIAEFEKPIFIKRFMQFKDDIIECEYYERQRAKVFVGELKDLIFESLHNKNAS
jgi:hypothetical protein